MLAGLTLKEYISRLASRSGYPGGGSADDAVLALGIALIEMALHLSGGRDSSSLRRLGVLRQKAERLISKDAAVFKAYLHSRGKKENLNSLWDVSRESAEVASEVLKAGIKAEKAVKDSLASDLIIGISFAAAALDAAVVNLKVNCRFLGGGRRREALIAKYEKILAGWRRKEQGLKRRRLYDC